MRGDDGRAVALYEKSCDGGEPRGCGRLGYMYFAGRGVTQDDERAVELFHHACERDDARAAEIYRETCSDGDMAGCSSLASSYEAGAGVARDDMRAAELYRQACDAHDRNCTDLGRMYRNGTGVKQSDRRALELFRKACTAGEDLACGNVCSMHDRGAEVLDIGTAFDACEQACVAGFEDGCTYFYR